MRQPLRILLALEPSTPRGLVSTTLHADPAFEITAELGQARQAVEACAKLRPDVLVMSGERSQCLDAIGQIMARSPLPILLLTDALSDSGSRYQAIAAGALEVLEAPAGVSEGWADTLTRIVTTISRVKVITHMAGRYPRDGQPAAPRATGPARATRPQRLVALGASTGGPLALAKVLGALPEDFPLPIVVALHVGGEIGESPAAWLKHHCRLAVATAADGEPMPRPGRGRVIIAPAGSHLIVAQGCLRLSAGPERNSCRPSIDVLFESLAAEIGPATIACLLTGMGRDGAEGLLAIRRAGGITLAQDAASSVVFGMPKAAIEIGAAQSVLPLADIAPALVTLATAGQW